MRLHVKHSYTRPGSTRSWYRIEPEPSEPYEPSDVHALSVRIAAMGRKLLGTDFVRIDVKPTYLVMGVMRNVPKPKSRKAEDFRSFCGWIELMDYE